METKNYQLIKTNNTIIEYSYKEGGGYSRRFETIKLQAVSEPYPLMTVAVEADGIPTRWYVDITWDQLKFIGEKLKMTDLELLIKTSVVWIIIYTFIDKRELAEEMFVAWTNVKKNIFFGINDLYNKEKIKTI